MNVIQRIAPDLQSKREAIYQPDRRLYIYIYLFGMNQGTSFVIVHLNYRIYITLDNKIFLIKSYVLSSQWNDA